MIEIVVRLDEFHGHLFAAHDMGNVLFSQVLLSKGVTQAVEHILELYKCMRCEVRLLGRIDD